jgi:homoserine kinase
MTILKTTPGDSVRVSVPGTTANLGPGFDAFGLALDLSNTVTVTRTEPKPPLSPMIESTAASFFRGSALPPFPFAWSIKGKVPQSRGLGSSVTVRLGTLLALNELAGRPLSRNGLFRLCADLEGHPDNAAPALFGGFTIARGGKDPIRFPVSDTLRFVLLVPGFEVSTPEARKVMPKSIRIPDAAANAADAAVIAAAFATRKYSLLRGAFGDRMHQPHRARLVPFLEDVIAAGEAAGAVGGWLSGSGSTICCLSPDAGTSSAIARAMKKAAPAGSATITASADNRGAIILR